MKLEEFRAFKRKGIKKEKIERDKLSAKSLVIIKTQKKRTSDLKKKKKEKKIKMHGSLIKNSFFD